MNIYPSEKERVKIIAKLNDRCRKQHLGNCKWVLTSGIDGLPQADKLAIFRKVREFDDFTRDNDPYGEHDFGAFDHNGHRIFWKIDYYDPSLQWGSEDPTDPEKTCRVLTILLAEEY